MSLTSYRAAPPRDKLWSQTIILIVPGVIRRIAKARYLNKLWSQTIILIVPGVIRRIAKVRCVFKQTTQITKRPHFAGVRVGPCVAALICFCFTRSRYNRDIWSMVLPRAMPGPVLCIFWSNSSEDLAATYSPTP
jgi:hypothetical protein